MKIVDHKMLRGGGITTKENISNYAPLKNIFSLYLLAKGNAALSLILSKKLFKVQQQSEADLAFRNASKPAVVL